MKFQFRIKASDAEALFVILPPPKLLTFNMPSTGVKVVDAVFTSPIELEELNKIILQLANGTAMMESFKLNYD